MTDTSNLQPDLISARFYGYVDGRYYHECNATYYDFEGEEIDAYNDGYGHGMDLNIEEDKGICTDEER